MVGTVNVTGLSASETLLGIDYRPADGLLYALGSAGNVYTIAPSTGVATLKAALKAAPGDDDPFAALSGNDFAVDFNPVADRMRVVSNLGQNLRINVDTGDAITDGLITLAGRLGQRHRGGLHQRVLRHDRDATVRHRCRQRPAASAGPAEQRHAGRRPRARRDRQRRSTASTSTRATTPAMPRCTVGSATNLYRVNIATGAATALGAIAGGEAIRGLALQQPAAPSVLGLTATNQLVAFDPKAPNTITSTTAITGLGAGETVIGIDTRPKDGAALRAHRRRQALHREPRHRRGHAEGDAGGRPHGRQRSRSARCRARCSASTSTRWPTACA